MAEGCTIFILRIERGDERGALRLVLHPLEDEGAQKFTIETLEKDAAGGDRWIAASAHAERHALIAMALSYLLQRRAEARPIIEVGRVTIKPPASASARMALDDRQMALDDSRPVAASASARMALDSPPVAASASARMALDTDTEANRKSRDIFDAQAYDLLATRNAASARGEAVQSIEALFAEELRGRCRALKSVDGLANALAAACDEISAHDACAATLEGEYAMHRTPPERVAEWRKLAQEQA